MPTQKVKACDSNDITGRTCRVSVVEFVVFAENLRDGQVYFAEK